MKAGFSAAAPCRLKTAPGFPSQKTARRDKPTINIDIIFRHALDREAALERRANLGAVMVRLQEDSSNDSVAATNLQASESNIRDLNVSAETTKYSADQILISVGTSVLLQSNNNAQSVEKLFQ